MTKKKVFIIVFLSCLIGNICAFAQTVHNAVQAELIIKIIKLDRNFDRYKDPLKIGVTSKDMLKALMKYKNETVKGKYIEPEALNSLEDISNYDIIYVDRNWKSDYEAAASKAIEHKILMFSSSVNAVEDGLGGITFRSFRGKPKIVINLKVVKQEGTNFPSELLKLCQVVGK